MSNQGWRDLNVACQCNGNWNSILPPSPCPYHSPQAFNGLCYCRGPLNLHPFHSPTCGQVFTTSSRMTVDVEYVGKHRQPE